MLRKIVQVTQSPMNEKRWLLSFECGHERWATANRRPKWQEADCLDESCVAENVRRNERVLRARR